MERLRLAVPLDIGSWREWRKVSQSLTLQYAKVMYLIEDRPERTGG